MYYHLIVVAIEWLLRVLFVCQVARILLPVVGNGCERLSAEGSFELVSRENRAAGKLTKGDKYARLGTQDRKPRNMWYSPPRQSSTLRTRKIRRKKRPNQKEKNEWKKNKTNGRNGGQRPESDFSDFDNRWRRLTAKWFLFCEVALVSNRSILTANHTIISITTTCTSNPINQFESFDLQRRGLIPDVEQAKNKRRETKTR